ncbi:hypothetical protein ES695_15865 [Candidatus Atribacteria bacterium 1244-E10-H5-B2]|nr:MAG: hypothetical protein ES695_15865 [Candidatus Atribacteria bacterium 1244-E10-H5-B2]
MAKEEYKKRVWEILKGHRYGLGEEDIKELLELIMAVPFDGEFVVHNTYFPHNDKKKVLE